MNSIDKKFKELMDDIDSKSLDEVYQFIKDTFDKQLEADQEALIKYFQTFDYWGVIDKENDNYEELHNRAVALKEHTREYRDLYKRLGDYRSKLVLFAVLNNWYRFDYRSLKTCREYNYRQYFDLDILKCNKDEVIVDLGAFTGDTVKDYVDSYGIDNYKKIYCYEMSFDNFIKLIDRTIKYKNIIRRNVAVSDTKGVVYIDENSFSSSANRISDSGEKKVETITLDEEITEKITLLKMDIEGAEKKAIMGAKNHIINDNPKLLISVYHNHEDLYKIPSMINELNNNYKYYLRYYSGSLFPTEIVLIGIPRRK